MGVLVQDLSNKMELKQVFVAPDIQAEEHRTTCISLFNQTRVKIDICWLELIPLTLLMLENQRKLMTYIEHHQLHRQVNLETTKIWPPLLLPLRLFT